jgi:uncharacterized membrane protein
LHPAQRISMYLTLSLVTLALATPSLAQNTPSNPAQEKKPAASTPSPPPAPNAPQSTHYPILLLAFGSEPSWSVRIGPKGPELLQRQGYPPALLDPSEIAREGTSDAWDYRAKDTATGAEATLRLTREPCSDANSPTKYTFRAVFEHAQIGTLTGCARIAAELFPRLPNQTAQADADDATEKKPPLLPPISNAKAPVAVAYVTATGKIVVSRAGVRKIAASSGAQLALSHDGKRLLYTRPDAKGSTTGAIVLYEFDTGRSRDLVHGSVGEAFWSPDDSRIAYVNTVEQKSQIWAFAADHPENAAPFSPQDIATLQGWTDTHTVLATDAVNGYWLSDEKPAQIVALKEIYGTAFQVAPSDTLRNNPANPDILLVSAALSSPPTGALVDASGFAYGFFLYELRSKRRVVMSPPDQSAEHAEWTRDGLQIFYAKRAAAGTFTTFRLFWDGTGVRRYLDGSELVVGQ